MSAERLPMRKLREILRLHHEAKLSAQAIGRSCRISSSTVLKYLGRARVAKLVWPLPDDLDDVSKCTLSSRPRRIRRRFETLHDAIAIAIAITFNSAG